MLGPHALLCIHALGDIPIHSRDAYTTRQGNVHYVYHNAAVMVDILNGCPASTAPGECSLD